MDKSMPNISIIIPCRDDSEWIGRVLDALARQTYPQDQMEIFVVDNGSRDNSVEEIESYPVQLLSEPQPSAYKARNRAIAVATGDYCLFLDADTIPVECWAEELVKTAMDSGFHLVGGRIENHISRPGAGSALLAYTRSAEVRRRAVEAHGRLSGGNMLVARKAFDQFGLFSPLPSGSDGEFSERANPERKPIPYAAKAVVLHQCDLSTWGYLLRTVREHRGQAANGAPGVSGEMWLNLLRPGFRRAIEVRAEISSQVNAGVVRLVIIFWLERLFAVFGRCAGKIDWIFKHD